MANRSRTRGKERPSERAMREAKEAGELGTKTPARGPQPPRLSITVDEKLRKKIRIASARADMEIGEWCKNVLATAAQRTMERLYPEEVD